MSKKLYDAATNRLRETYMVATSGRCSASDLRDLLKSANTVCTELADALERAAVLEQRLSFYGLLDDEAGLA
jgi:hypothetical protein